MKHFKSWQFYLLVAVIIAIALEFNVLYIDATERPNTLWSKEITLETTSEINNKDPYYENYFDITTYNNVIYYAEIINKALTVSTYDASFNKISVTNTPVDFDMVTDFSLSVDQDGYHILLTSNNLLYAINTDKSLNNIELIPLINRPYEIIAVSNSAAIFKTANEYTYVTDSESKILNINNEFDSFNFFKQDHEIYINGITYENGIFYANVMKYDLNSGLSNIIYHGRLTGQSTTVPLETIIYVDDGTVYTHFSLKNTKYGQNYNYFFEFDKSTYSLNTSETFENTSYYPNFQFVDYDGNSALIYNDSSFIGKTDLSSQDNTFTNVHLSSGFNKDAITLTNSAESENNVHFFNFENNYYLVSNVYYDHTNELRVSSTSSELIKKSTIVSNKGKIHLFFNALTYIPASIMTLMGPLIMMIFPVIIVILPIAIFKMAWAEKNQSKLLKIAVGAYFISKAYYLVNNRNTMIINGLSIGAEPFHLANLGFLLLTGVFTSLISLLCLKDYDLKHKDTFFINKFFFFYGIEMILFLFYFTIYTIMFL